MHIDEFSRDVFKLTLNLHGEKHLCIDWIIRICCLIIKVYVV